MILGEKLKMLRKQKGMSQEQLASQIGVSRQAVSKWELGSSLPDIEMVVSLSEVFQVSTDYLLKDRSDANGEDRENIQLEKGQPKEKKVAILSTGILVIGLLISFAGWRTYQTIPSVVIGLVVQIIGIVLFELLSEKKDANSFYIRCCWLICPYIIFLVMGTLSGDYMKPYSHWSALLMPGSIYVIVCSVLTAGVMVRKRKEDLA